MRAVLLVVLLAGCFQPMDLAAPAGQPLPAPFECGTHADGVPAQCHTDVREAAVFDEMPVGWIETLRVSDDLVFYHRITVEPPGQVLLGVYYRHPIDTNHYGLPIDSLAGMAQHPAWDELVAWHSPREAYVEFPEPIGQGEFRMSLFDTFTWSKNTTDHPVPRETPWLHDRPIEPLWSLVDGEVRVVHRIDAEGGPYYLHDGLATPAGGYSLVSEGPDHYVESVVSLAQFFGRDPAP